MHWGGPILHIAAALPRDPLPYIDSATAGAGGAFLGVCCFLGVEGCVGVDWVGCWLGVCFWKMCCMYLVVFANMRSIKRATVLRIPYIRRHLAGDKH